MEFTMRNKIIAIFVALGLSLSITAPARAQFWGVPYYGGWGYGGIGYGAAIAGIGIASAVIGSAIVANQYPYGYGYGYSPYVPVYEPVYPAYSPRPTVRKQIIIRNSPGARVYEEDDIFGW